MADALDLLVGLVPEDESIGRVIDAVGPFLRESSTPRMRDMIGTARVRRVFVFSARSTIASL